MKEIFLVIIMGLTAITANAYNSKNPSLFVDSIDINNTKNVVPRLYVKFSQETWSNLTNDTAKYVTCNIFYGISKKSEYYGALKTEHGNIMKFRTIDDAFDYFRTMGWGNGLKHVLTYKGVDAISYILIKTQ